MTGIPPKGPPPDFRGCEGCAYKDKLPTGPEPSCSLFENTRIRRRERTYPERPYKTAERPNPKGPDILFPGSRQMTRRRHDG